MTNLSHYFLARQSDSGRETFGLFQQDDTTICVTIERPWLNNEHGISCIPPGTYSCKRILSPHNGDCWEVMDVTDRTNIEIHAANMASQVKGCIAVGDRIGQIDGIPAVLNSKKTLAMLHSILPDEFKLTIVGVNYGNG